jgi:hypothetical protein
MALKQEGYGYSASGGGHAVPWREIPVFGFGTATWLASSRTGSLVAVRQLGKKECSPITVLPYIHPREYIQFP